MILKGNLHGDGAKLARYMLTGKDGELAEFIQSRGLDFFSSDPIEAFALMQGMAEAKTKSTMPFFHGQFRAAPEDKPLTAAQVIETADRMEKRLGFTGQPRMISLHTDIETGEKNYHVAWFRMDVERERVIDPGLFPFRLKDEARKIEKDFGLRIVSNERKPGDRARAADRNELEESRRLKTNIKEIRNGILDCFEKSDNGKSFAAAIRAHGWQVATGDRDNFVVIDHASGHHALNKKLTGKTLEEIRNRLADLDRSQLPSVDQAKESQAARRAARETRRDYEALAPVKPLEQTNTLLGDGARAPERPLNRTQGDLRIAFSLSGSREELQEALAGRHIRLARVSTDEARESREQGKLYREQKRRHEVEAKVNPYATLKPAPTLRYAPTLKQGEIVAVDGRGQVYRLDKRTTGIEKGEIEKRLGGIDRDGLQNITDAKAAMIEARSLTQETERAQRRIDAPLGKTAGEIRTAWTLSRSQEQLHEALAGRGMGIARVTAEEASERNAASAKELGSRARVLKEGELVAVNSFGSVYRFDEHTTGQFRSEIDKRLALIDAGSLLSVADTTARVRETAKAAWLDKLRDERDQQRPASAIEQKIMDCRDSARATGATVQQNRAGEIVSAVDALADRLRPENERQTHSATIHGPQAVAARLDQAGIAIVRVTEADVKALDALRSAEELARASAQDVQARKPQHFAKVKVGDIAAVTRAGNVFRLNPHRLDLAGLESAISSTVPQSKRTSSAGLLGVTETRARFESEGQKKTALWDERRVASAERRASREQSFGRQQTMRGAASATLKVGETVNRSTTRAGKGAGILGRGIIGALAGLLKLFDIAPAKPPSPEQQKRNFYAAQEQQASDDIQARKDATDEQRRQHRKTQEQDSRTAQILGTPPAAHDRQRPREHERDR